MPVTAEDATDVVSVHHAVWRYITIPGVTEITIPGVTEIGLIRWLTKQPGAEVDRWPHKDRWDITARVGDVAFDIDVKDVRYPSQIASKPPHARYVVIPDYRAWQIPQREGRRRACPGHRLAGPLPGQDTDPRPTTPGNGVIQAHYVLNLAEPAASPLVPDLGKPAQLDELRVPVADLAAIADTLDRAYRQTHRRASLDRLMEHLRTADGQPLTDGVLVINAGTIRILNACTGSGKSVLATLLAEWAVPKGLVTTIVVPRNDNVTSLHLQATARPGHPRLHRRGRAAHLPEQHAGRGGRYIHPKITQARFLSESYVSNAAHARIAQGGPTTATAST